MKGTYTLSLPEELHEKIEQEAKLNKMSPNEFVLYTLTREISYREGERRLKDRIERAPSYEEALRILKTVVPDIPPLPGDELPVEEESS